MAGYKQDEMSVETPRGEGHRRGRRRKLQKTSLSWERRLDVIKIRVRSSAENVSIHSESVDFNQRDDTDGEEEVDSGHLRAAKRAQQDLRTDTRTRLIAQLWR